MKTLLEAVNEILKRTGIISGDSGELTSLTDSARQRAIDVAVQVINEALDELYESGTMAKPLQQVSTTLVLVQGQREYALPDDLVRLRYPMIDRTNNQYIQEHAGGYNQALIDDPEQDDLGLPRLGSINPETGELHLERAPTDKEAGRVYNYHYDVDTDLTLATDTVPFNNIVFRAMVPAWVQTWKRTMRQEFDEDEYSRNFGRASSYLSRNQNRTNWSPR